MLWFIFSYPIVFFYMKPGSIVVNHSQEYSLAFTKKFVNKK